MLNTREIGIHSESRLLANDPRGATTASVNYFGGANSIPITAFPWPGWELDHFSVGGTRVPASDVRNDHGRIFINVSPGAQVTVTFRQSADATVVIDRVQARSQNWFRVTNNTDRPLNTRGLYLSDNYNSDEESESRRPHDQRFRMPALILRPGMSVDFALSSNDDDVLKRCQTNFSLSFGERFRMADSQGNVIQHIEVALMGRSQVMERGLDGFWTVNDGPCRDCGRCGCRQCFPPSGLCPNQDCERCYPPIPPGPAIINVTGGVENARLEDGNQRVRATITEPGSAWSITVSIPGATQFLHGSPWGVPPFATVSPLSNGIFVITGSPWTQWGNTLDFSVNWQVQVSE
jgi:hypothetical protein